MSVESATRLIETLRTYGPCAVAFSGGVDSAVVAAAAYRALGNEAYAITAVSPSLSRSMRESAGRVASEIGIRHQWMHTSEVDDERYLKNDLQRCYYCKSHLYAGIGKLKEVLGDIVLVSGTNADDLKDYRPGLIAGKEAGVRTPLADLGWSKSMVRSVAAYFGLSVAEHPASPCLSSRIAYGETVTPERLQRIDRAEDWLRERGFSVVRVRLVPGELARIEVPLEQLGDLVSEGMRAAMVQEFRKLGFKGISLDLEGFRSGNLNQIVSIRSIGAGISGSAR